MPGGGLGGVSFFIARMRCEMGVCVTSGERGGSYRKGHTFFIPLLRGYTCDLLRLIKHIRVLKPVLHVLRVAGRALEVQPCRILPCHLSPVPTPKLLVAIIHDVLSSAFRRIPRSNVVAALASLIKSYKKCTPRGILYVQSRCGGVLSSALVVVVTAGYKKPASDNVRDPAIAVCGYSRLRSAPRDDVDGL